MTARNPWQPGAGPWVACIERPHLTRPGEVLRSYPWSAEPARWGGWSWTSNPEDAIRYDTKAEALAAVAGPRRVGWRRIAHRVGGTP